MDIMWFAVIILHFCHQVVVFTPNSVELFVTIGKRYCILLVYLCSISLSLWSLHA